MKILIFLFFFAILLTCVGYSSQALAKSTKYTEILDCKAGLECTSVFEIPKGAKATLTISPSNSKPVNFVLKDPSGNNVRLSSGAFPDSAQVITRVMNANVGGDYTFYLTPQPQNFRVQLIVVVDDMQTTSIQNIPTASQPKFGGCLIATATYGSELAPQVQQLREIRDHKLLQTKSGSEFISSFNSLYYSFSPYIADYERENSFFKDSVKIAITPMILSLSILNGVDLDTEAKVLWYGISLILLNIGMYFGIPVVAIIGIRKLS